MEAEPAGGALCAAVEFYGWTGVVHEQEEWKLSPQVGAGAPCMMGARVNARKPYQPSRKDGNDGGAAVGRGGRMGVVHAQSRAGRTSRRGGS